MPSILFYALDPDLQTVADRLNDDPDVAFVVADGPRRWRAVDRVPRIGAGCHALWLKPGGALPLVGRAVGDPEEPIVNPEAGWEERLPSAIPGRPFFGSHPAVVWLDVPAGDGGTIPMSAVGWIGDRYRAIGVGATPAAAKWWKHLQRWFRGRTTVVARGGLHGTGPVDVNAFPGAMEQLKSGVPGEFNPPAS